MELLFYKYNDTNGNLIPSALVDDFESFVFTRSYSGTGSFQLVISADSKNAGFIMNSDIVSVRENTAGVITKITKSTTDSGNVLTVRGTELKGLVNGRLVMPPSGSAYQTFSNTPAASVMSGLIRTQLTEAEADRKIYGSITSNASGERISYSGRYSRLDEDMQEISETYGIGYCADVRDNRIRWKVYAGKDRRKTQSINSRMVFSYDLDTLESSELEMALNTTNYLVIAGQGEGADRDIAEIGSSTGFRRYESFVDARDVAEHAALIRRGEETLSSYGDSTVFSARLPENIVDRYLKDFDLGDICTIEDCIGGEKYSIDARITEFTECCEENAMTVDVSFGYDRTGLADVISRIRSETKSLINKE